MVTRPSIFIPRKTDTVVKGPLPVDWENLREQMKELLRLEIAIADRAQQRRQQLEDHSQ